MKSREQYVPCVVRLYWICVWVAGKGGRGALGIETGTLGQDQLEGLCLNARLRLYPVVHREPQVSRGKFSFQAATWMEGLDLEENWSQGDRQEITAIIQARDGDPDEGSNKGVEGSHYIREMF